MGFESPKKEEVFDSSNIEDEQVSDAFTVVKEALDGPGYAVSTALNRFSSVLDEEQKKNLIKAIADAKLNISEKGIRGSLFLKE